MMHGFTQTQPTIENRVRSSIEQDQLDVLTQFYSHQFNIVIWRRSLSDQLQAAAEFISRTHPGLQLAISVDPEKTASSLTKEIGSTELCAVFSKDVAELVEIFCCLFDQKNVGLRLKVLDSAMCPRFHVDRVPCRLVTTYHGMATQWLPDSAADRSKLGTGNGGFPDDASGLFTQPQSIQSMRRGDVALLKGELWEDNEGSGIIHRSPHISNSDPRLLLTLDLLE